MSDCELRSSSLSHDLGARNQARMHTKKIDWKKILAQRLKTYAHHASRYNTAHSPHEPLAIPSLDTINGMTVSDPSWEMAGLTHPDEDWAADPKTRTGIDAFRTQQSCYEDMPKGS